MCWISTTKEETSAALNRCHQLAGELDKRVPHGERGEKEELKHVPGPSLLTVVWAHTHTDYFQHSEGKLFQLEILYCIIYQVWGHNEDF